MSETGSTGGLYYTVQDGVPTWSPLPDAPAPRTVDVERVVTIAARALVAVVLCLTGSCTIQRCFAPVPPEPPVRACAYRYSPGCDAPAAYCGHHASPESVQ